MHSDRPFDKLRVYGYWLLRHANPGLGSTEQSKAYKATNFEFFAAINGRQLELVNRAIVWIDNIAAFPDILAFSLLGSTNDLQPEHGLVLAIIGAFIAHRLLIRVLAQQLVNVTTEHTAALRNNNQALDFTGFVVNGVPASNRRHLRLRAAKSANSCQRQRCANHKLSRLHYLSPKG